MSTEDDAKPILGKITIGDLGDAEATFSVEIPAFVAAGLRPEIVVDADEDASEEEVEAALADLLEDVAKGMMDES